VSAPESLTALHERVVELARSLKVTRGRKLRADSLVVQTTIHHPTDSGLISDGVRVLSRVLRRAKAVVGQVTALSQAAFRSRMRSVRRLVHRLHRLARRKGEEATAQLQLAYGRRLTVARKTQAQAAKVCVVLHGQTGASAQRLLKPFKRFLPRMAQVSDHTVRRGCPGALVPAPDQLVSVFAPHTQMIVRRKTGKPVACGRTVGLEEVAGGMLSGSRILAEAGQDCPAVPDSLGAHAPRVGRPPPSLAAARGGDSAAHEAKAPHARVRGLVMPSAGKAPPARVAQGRTTWFRRGLRCRAGIAGRISGLRRRFGGHRCRDHGEAGLGRWVGWGMVPAHLITSARPVAGRPARSVGRAADHRRGFTTRLESLGRLVVQKTEEVTCIAAIATISHQKLVLDCGAKPFRK
jgi:transposase, IS5 family